jgi:REP element-mobilizing transposase RayT
MFVTSTALDFAHIFRRQEIRREASRLFLDDVCHYGAALYAYVFMTHHMHAVVQAPPEKSVSWFMQRFKSNSSKVLWPLLNPHERTELSRQSGLNNSQLWMRSFRGVTILDDRMLLQKIHYVEANPIRSGFSEDALNYPWCSARLHRSVPWSSSDGFARTCLDEIQTPEFAELVLRYESLHPA